VIALESNPDYVAVLDAYNEAIAQAQKGKPIPTANMYVLAVQKHLTSILLPGHNRYYNHRIGDPDYKGKCARDAPTEEERRRLKLKQAEK